MIFYPRQISLALIHFALLYEPFMIHDDDDDGCTGFQEKPIKRTSQPFLPFLPYFIFFISFWCRSISISDYFSHSTPSLTTFVWPEVGIYKRKKESKKTRKKRKQELNQESDQEKRKFYFSWSLSWSSPCILSFFLVFLIAFLVEFLFSFINSHLRCNEAIANFKEEIADL